MRVQMFLLIKYADRDEKHEMRQPRPSIRSYEKRQITLQFTKSLDKWMGYSEMYNDTW